MNAEDGRNNNSCGDDRCHSTCALSLYDIRIPSKKPTGDEKNKKKVKKEANGDGGYLSKLTGTPTYALCAMQYCKKCRQHTSSASTKGLPTTTINALAREIATLNLLFRSIVDDGRGVTCGVHRVHGRYEE